MKIEIIFYITFLLIFKCSSQITEKSYFWDVLTATTSTNYEFSATSQIYNTELIAVSDHNGKGTENHRGYIGIFNVSSHKMLSWVNIYPTLSAGDEYWAEATYMVNLLNSNNIVCSVWWGRHGYYTNTFIGTWDTNLNFISSIDSQYTFYPGNNDNMIMVPNGNTLNFYNVITGELYQNFTSPTQSDIVWACAGANYYAISIYLQIEFYELQTLTQAKIITGVGNPIQVKPYHFMNQETIIPSYYIYSSWKYGSTYTAIIIDTENFGLQTISQWNTKFFNCAPGDSQSLELICQSDKAINYILNQTISGAYGIDIGSIPVNQYNSTFTTNSSYYSIYPHHVGFFAFSPSSNFN